MKNLLKDFFFKNIFSKKKSNKKKVFKLFFFKRNFLFSFVLFFSIILSCQVFANEVLIDEIYFVVNNRVITKSDFDKEEASQKKVLENDPSGNLKDKITRELILSNMVIFSMVENELSLKNFSVTPEDVTNAIKQIMYKNNIQSIEIFKTVLEKQMPFEQFYQQQKKGLVMQKFMQLALQNSPAKNEPNSSEVNEFYRQNKELFRIKSKIYKLKKISLNVPANAKFSEKVGIEKKINSIKEEIDTQKISFEKGVLKYSQDPNSKLSLGDIGWILQEDPRWKTLNSQLKDLSIDEVSNPISMNNETAIYKILATKQNGFLSLTEVENKIKVILQQQQQQKIISSEIAKLIKSSYIAKKTKKFPKLTF